MYEWGNEQDIAMSRICTILHSTEDEITEMYSEKSLDVNLLLECSK